MLKNLKVGRKILLAFALVTAMTLFACLASLNEIIKLSNTAENYADITLPAVNHLWTARRSIRQIEENALSAILADTKAELAEVESKLIQNRQTFDTALKDFLAIAPQFNEQILDINKQMEQITIVREKVLNECRKLTAQGDAAAYEIYRTEYTTAYEAVALAMQAMSTEVDRQIGVRNDNAQASKQYSIFMTILTSTVAVALSLVLAVALRKMILRPIREIRNAVEHVSSGNFEAIKLEYDAKDELGDLAGFIRDTVAKQGRITDDLVSICHELGNGNFVIQSTCVEEYSGDYFAMLAGLRFVRDMLAKTLLHIDTASDQVLSSSNQVANGSQSLAQGATQQASAVEQLLSNMTEMQRQVEENANHANQASNMVGEVGAGMSESNRIMGELMDAMENINATSKEIGKVIKSIDDIAFQTNILALNAAVEAARAGAAGKGFAVVADEVRSLAAKSAESVKTTTVLIQNTLDAIARGSQLANSTSEALSGVVTKASSANDRVLEIARASAEQLEAVNHMTIGIEQISAVVHSTSATAEESAAASEELSSQANLLKSMISKFQISEDVKREATKEKTNSSPFDNYTVSYAYDSGDKY